MIKTIGGKLSCEARPPKAEWIACSRKKKHRAGDDRFVPPSVKVTYTHTTKVNGVSVPLKKEVMGSLRHCFLHVRFNALRSASLFAHAYNRW